MGLKPPLDFFIFQAAVSRISWLCFFSVSLSLAADKRCDLTGPPKTTGSGTAYTECVDMDALNGKTVTIPSNVTRINQDGLSFCKDSQVLGGNADIVYVLDQSGSMRPRGMHISPTGDTSYIEVLDNIPNAPHRRCKEDLRLKKIGTVTVPSENGTTTLDLIDPSASIEGCPLAGDPFTQRAIAYRSAIDYQAQRSPNSTAGYLGFHSSIVSGQSQAPLVLSNQTNINTIKSKIFIPSLGGTRYKAPLEQSKKWLTDPNLSKNPQKAVIFLSDGLPTDTDYLNVLNTAYSAAPGTMPPIYGIFLGNPTAPYQKLEELSTLTGGQFYLIPPNRPDSLKSVVESILNVILKNYEPIKGTVANESLSPVQSGNAGATDFTKQADGSWLMHLDQIVGIRQGTNAITLESEFRETYAGTVEKKTITFTLSATGNPVGGNITLPGNEFAALCYDKSSLEILTTGGLTLPFLSERDSTYRVRVITSSLDLSAISPNAATLSKTDAEILSLASPSISGDKATYAKNFLFQVIGGVKTDGNALLESNLYDSVIVSWQHPRDPQDLAVDTVKVQAAFQPAEVYFSITAGGAKTDLYPITQKTAYIVVKDQIWNPAFSYKVSVSSSVDGEDREVLNLTELTPGGGVYGAQVDFSSLIKTTGDNFLQVSLGGDQLKAVYIDPIYGDTAVGTAGFDQSVQEAARVEFTDAAGRVLSPEEIWSPENGKIFLRYSDDLVYGNITAKEAVLVVSNRKYGAQIGSDQEKVALSLLPGQTGTRGTWQGSINLKDIFPALSGNSLTETHFRGEVTASVLPHGNTGLLAGSPVTDFLVVAYPDQAASVAYDLAPSTSADLEAGIENWTLTINDQSYSAGKDTVSASIRCNGSGDSVGSVILIEGEPGVYQSSSVKKDLGTPNRSDNTLSCRVADQIVITYIDPVYGTSAELVVNEVARPVAAPSTTKFYTGIGVILSSATSGSKIYYTLDGSLPDTTKTLYTGPVSIIATSTLKAIAVRPGWKTSKILIEVYTKEFQASSLEILDKNGNPLTGKQLSSQDSILTLRLRTTQAGLTDAQVSSGANVSGDTEAILLSYGANLGDRFEFRETFPFSFRPASKNNGSLELSSFDTLIVRWQNPVDPNDIASDTAFIRPTFRSAEVYFSDTDGGQRITEYPPTQDSVFIVIKDQIWDPRFKYTVTVRNTVGGADIEILDLRELSPGVYAAKVPVTSDPKEPDDKVLQVSPGGDQLIALFVDPVYGDTAIGNAGFGQGVQETAVLEFIDAKGNVLSPGEIWDPTQGMLYIRLSDDWNPSISALVATKELTLKVVNRKSGLTISGDQELIQLTLVSNTATKGVWEGSIVLKDTDSSVAGNGAVEIYFRGEVTASVISHDNVGASIEPPITDFLVVAYPDKSADITIRDPIRAAVDRFTGKLLITVDDQVFSRAGSPSITVTVACAASGDVVENVELVLADSSGHYVITQPLDKTESLGGNPDRGDLALACRESDIITVTYRDPVYSTVRTGEVRYFDEQTPRLYFASLNDTAEISSSGSGQFLVVVEARTPNRGKVDTIQVKLTTTQGDMEVFQAIETDSASGKFLVQAGFGFGTKAPTASSGKIEAQLDPADPNNAVKLTGSVTLAGKTATSDLLMLSRFNPVIHAYIKDLDGNGRGDAVYFVFQKKLTELPSQIAPIYWNKIGSEYARKADGTKTGQIKFVPGSDSTVLMVDFSGDEFGVNLTSAAEGAKPYAQFPEDGLFGGQTPTVADSLGPIIVSAVKKPSDMSAVVQPDGSLLRSPDTLLITISEKLTTSSDWLHLIKFSRGSEGCRDYAESVHLNTLGAPQTTDGVTWTVVVDNTPGGRTPLVGNCMYINTGGEYTDPFGNLPSELGVILEGRNPATVIQSFQGYPPVAGIGADEGRFVLVNNDLRAGNKGTWAKNPAGGGKWVIDWIPPVGWQQNRDFNPYIPPRVDEKPQEDLVEHSPPFVLPGNVSAIQVISTTRYIAHITIFDNLGQFVKKFTQAFGYQGEMNNPNRIVNKGVVSYLVWDLKDKNGRQAGQGAYVWKVLFTFENKKQEVQITRTGILRSP